MDLLSVSGPKFAFQANPLFYFSAGYALRDGFDAPSDRHPYWRNTRGIRLSGHIGRHIFFETRMEENQRLPLRPEFYKFSAPRLARTKWDVGGETPYDEAVRTPYDYFLTTGVAGFRSPSFEIRFGRDRNLWGNGRSSVQLSNYAPAYDQLQIRTTVWRLQYVNLFTAMTDLASIDAPPFAQGRAPEQVFPRRYGAFHDLSVNLPLDIRLHFFEGIIFAPDSTGRRDRFDISYMNPIIFYRAVETDRGSPDNAVLGAGISWTPVSRFNLYAEFVLDELRVRELTDPGDGWWGNKWATLTGIHIVDPLPYANLSIRLEYARNRPFMYSHRSPANAYAHFADLLGHPAGPNASDWAIFVESQPYPQVRFSFNVALSRIGRNPDDVNYGSDPLVSYNDNRPTGEDGEILMYGFTLHRGIPQHTILAEMHAGYELLPGLFLETMVQSHVIDDKERGTDWYVVPTFGVRWGLPFDSIRY
jgi:hypothetical protein